MCALIGNLALFGIIVLDIDGMFITLVPALLIGVGVGGFWVLVAEILIDDAGLDEYGQIWGLSILFNFIGIFLFDLVIYFIDIGVGAGLMFVLLGIVGLVCTILAHQDDKKK